MSKELKHKLFLPTDCLSEKMMFDYIDNKLTHKERHLVEKHLLDCEMCTDAMEGLELLKNRNRINLINQKVIERIAPTIKKETPVISLNYRMLSSIAAGLLLLIGGVFFFNNFMKKEMKQSDVAELKQPLPALSPAPEQTVTDTEEIKLAAGKDTKEKAANENTEQQNQLAFAKEEKPNPDYKAIIVNADKGVNNSLKQEEVVTKSDEDKNAENIPVETDDSKVVLLESEKDVAGDETKEKQKGEDGVVAGYQVTQPTSPAQNNDNEIAARLSKKSETKKELSDNRLRHEAEGKKDKANKAEDRQIAVTGSATTSAPQSATSAYEQKPQTVVTTTESTVMMDSLSANIEPMPTFPGGIDSLNRFIKNHFIYPSGYYSWNSIIGNKITVDFTVDKTGQVTHPKITKGINTELNNEALRVVNSLPKWIPAKRNGKSVSSVYHLQIDLDTKQK